MFRITYVNTIDTAVVRFPPYFKYLISVLDPKKQRPANIGLQALSRPICCITLVMHSLFFRIFIMLVNTCNLFPSIIFKYVESKFQLSIISPIPFLV
ncbi:hypothetical protein SAMN05660816_04272 [Niastella yeongjuensis]|nr:hypothetical protein SAMN05660816_04272 [Niastella yeongjuensis]